jgi:hypothetical protein
MRFRQRLIRDVIVILLWPYLAVSLMFLISWICDNADKIDAFFVSVLAKLV